MKYKTLLSKDGYIINKSKFDSKILDQLRNDLTVEPFKFGVSFGVKEKNEFFKVFRETDDIISIPKFFGLDKIGSPEKNTEIIGEEVNIKFTGELREQQQQIINTVMPILSKTDGGLICLGCGSGKCLAKNTKILMYDGTIKLVQDIIVGDVIMGDDSTPRNILSITKGRETMYKVNELRKNKEFSDNSYIVNESHILSLKNNDDILDISVKDYLKLPSIYHGDESPLRGYRVPVIFPKKELVVNSYTFGYSLENTNIPFEYKCNSRKNQLELLAGLIDKNGYYNENSYKIIRKNEELIDDIVYIARSLGFSALKKTLGNYYSTNIYGCRLEDIPVKYLKTHIPILNEEDNLRYPIKLEKLEEDDYYGFEIDGNRRFVLGDYTVTHNTVLALNIASLLKVKTLIIVHKSFLLNQWKERIEQFTDSPVGIIQQNKVDIDGKPFVIGMLQSISKDKYDSNIFSDFGLVIFDEAHHAPSQYFSKALPLISCKKTLALSATPKRSDKLEKVLHWYFGPIIYKNELEENKTVLAKLYKYNIVHEKFKEKKQRFTGEVNRPGTVTQLITIGRRNRFIIDIVEEILLEEGRKIIILSERVEHLELLKKRLDERELVTSGFYIGGMKQKKLDESAKCQVIFGTYQMASEALDIKGLNTLIMATARREIEQTIGRITRDPNAVLRPLVVDIIDNLDSFVRQGYYRRSFYRKNGFQIITSDVEDNNILNQIDITISHDNKEKMAQVNIDDVAFID